MNNQQNNQQSNANDSKTGGKVDIQPSEPETGSSDQGEENAPGRTPGKAEGSRENVEADLRDKEN
ncbi:MAG TPA: hypothetical protein VK308_13940 [Pyrinomonadaceae bacterium]|nr:hypothetical protein [Pyrinomonadaceae bacterium]